MRSHASSALAIPPTPISGISPPDAERNSRSAFSAKTLSGWPERPPASSRCFDLRSGRDTVVLATMIASMRCSSATRTIWSGSPSPRSGATLRKIGGPLAPRTSFTAESSVRSAPSS